MRFCPKCETRIRLKFDDDFVECPKCGSIVKQTEVAATTASVTAAIATTTLSLSTDKNISQEQNALRIMDEETTEVLPTINIECPKCQNNLAVWWMLQTRSADEATTQFYRCTKCKHTWRNYS